jgi:hypothetical protein
VLNPDNVRSATNGVVFQTSASTTGTHAKSSSESHAMSPASQDDLPFDAGVESGAMDDLPF